MYMYAVVIALILILAAAIWFVRKYFLEWMEPEADVTTQAFTLADLRQLHKNGALTDEEFERAKAKIVQNVQRAARQPEGGDAGMRRQGGDKLTR